MKMISLLSTGWSTLSRWSYYRVATGYELVNTNQVSAGMGILANLI